MNAIRSESMPIEKSMCLNQEALKSRMSELELIENQKSN
jgi:hypothetical protein